MIRNPKIARMVRGLKRSAKVYNRRTAAEHSRRYRMHSVPLIEWIQYVSIHSCISTTDAILLYNFCEGQSLFNRMSWKRLTKYIMYIGSIGFDFNGIMRGILQIHSESYGYEF